MDTFAIQSNCIMGMILLVVFSLPLIVVFVSFLIEVVRKVFLK